MQEINPAIDMLKSLLTPKPGFRWGSVVYEPDESDHSVEAELKRRLIRLANDALDQAERSKANPKALESLEFDEGIFDEIEMTLASDAESREFTDLAANTQNLIEVINHRSK